MGDCQARFRERLEVQFLRPTRQYFLGLDHFTDKPLFDPSLFVTIRKRLGNDMFDEMNRVIISGALGVEDQSIDNKTINNPEDSDFQGGRWIKRFDLCQ